MGKKSKLSRSSTKKNDKDKQDNSSSLPGWPGYRTREGRSGYDPIDTRTEAAHTAGTIIQSLFTGEVRNPIHLFLLGVLGVILLGPAILAIAEIRNGNILPWNAWIFLLIAAGAGVVMLFNFIRNLINVINK